MQDRSPEGRARLRMVLLLQLAVMVALWAEGSEQGRTPVGAGPPRAGSWQPAMGPELAKSPDQRMAWPPHQPRLRAGSFGLPWGVS